jgi:putative ABC transport system ATP-binding protein
MQPLVRLARVGKRYGSGAAAFDALRDVTLDVERGEFVTITGPSGSGKSSLLNLIGALDVPTSGRVLIDGKDLEILTERERSLLRLGTIGFVFQGFNLFPALTAAENVAWPLEFSGAPRAKMRARTAELLRRVGLEHRARHRPGEMSGGEQQRVAIARALVNEPSLLLADEPTGNLDSATGDAVLALLAELRRERGVTVVMVTHRHDAESLGDRVVELRDGVLHAECPRARAAAR